MESGFHKRNAILIAIVCFVCMLIGSFYDYQISSAVFNTDSWFGILGAAYGQMPVSLGLILSSVLLFSIMEKRMCIKSVLQGIACVLMCLLGAMQMWMEPMMYIPDMNMVFNTIINIVIIGGSSYLLLRYTKGRDQREVMRVVKFIIFVIFAQLILINIFKPLAARPRMRMLEVTPQAHFQNWWEFGTAQKTQLMAMLGIASEEFKSFPSGHTGSAAVLLAFSVLPLLHQDSKKAKQWFWIAVVVTILVAFSRIVMGAHFLSDVTMGFSVSFLCSFVGYRIFFKERKVK